MGQNVEDIIFGFEELPEHMKILFVLQCAHLAGTERIALGYMRELRRLGHQCEVVSLEPIAEMGPVLREEGIAATGLDFKRGFGIPAFFQLRRLIQRTKPDALFQMGHRLSSTLAVLTLPVPRRLYMSLHHHTGVKAAWKWKIYYRLVAAAFPRCVMLSGWLRAELLGFVPALHDRCEVLYSSIPLQAITTTETRSAARQKLGLPSDAWLVGAAGRQVPVKRFDVFLDTAALIAKHRPDAHFVLAGRGPDHERLRTQARALGLDARLTWIDWLQDVESFYRSLDVLMFNSDWDVLGMVPLEALAHGTPVVCSLVNGGLFEILPWPGKYSFNIHDKSGMAQAVLSLTGERAAQQVEEGRRQITLHHDPTGVAQRLLQHLG